MLLTFEQAAAEHVDEVLTLLDEAAAWLRQRHIVQWPEQFSSDTGWRRDRIDSYIEAGQTWLVRVGGMPVATFTIGGPDPDYADGWPSAADDGLYIFRMAVARDWAGHDIGGQILDWASAHAAATGRQWLRLDCSRDNQRLQQYYERRGFIRVGTVIRTITGDDGEPYTRRSGALYQRPAGAVFYTGKKGCNMPDRYDPTGEAAIWQQASNLVASMKRQTESETDEWNTALEQAARMLESEARGIRQAHGMYYRVISGSQYKPLIEEDC